jgi:type 1 glutamine amidotransferase
MSSQMPARAHLITGGYPPGSPSGHDHDYVRLRLLDLLAEQRVSCSVANDFADVARWLETSRLLITYVAGPYPSDEQDAAIRAWLRDGGRWLGLHGTSGGRAVRPAEGGPRRMVKSAHHATLGSFFLNHPPLCAFSVAVHDRENPLTRGLPPSFDVTDELYLIELQDPASTRFLLTTELAADPSPPGFGFAYDADTSLQPDGKTRVLAYTRPVGDGGVTYIALGHTSPPNVTPPIRGAWTTPEFETLLRNAIAWGMAEEAAAETLTTTRRAV